MSRPAVVAFLLDVSGTVRHFDAFERAWHEVVTKAKDGDTLVLAVVKRDARGGGGGEFPYLKKEQLPCYSPLEAPAIYRRKRSAVIATLERAFAEARSLPRPAAPHDRTLLLSSIRSIAKDLSAHDGPRALVLATDGLEDSAIARFENTPLTDPVINRLVENERTPDLRRQLTGVSAYVVAAGAPSDEKSSEVERFWLTYFQQMGARLPPERYAGRLLHYRR
jgi:hypothetical protein